MQESAHRLGSAPQRKPSWHRVRPPWVTQARHEGALLACSLLGIQPPLQLLQRPYKTSLYGESKAMLLVLSLTSIQPPRPAAAMTAAMQGLRHRVRKGLFRTRWCPRKLVRAGQHFAVPRHITSDLSHHKQAAKLALMLGRACNSRCRFRPRTNTGASA